MGRASKVVSIGASVRAPERPRHLPPVIVLNLFHTGLGIVRQLAGTGIRVVGLSADSHIYGNYSRLCEVRFAPNSQEQPQELADFLMAAASDLQGSVIFPTRDADLLFLDCFRVQLSRWYKLAIPSTSVLQSILDKSVLTQRAEAAGVSVPRAVILKGRSELKSAAEAVGFPSVIKPIRSIEWRRGRNWQAVGGRKAFRVNSMLELDREYARISRIRADMMLQEWIPGKTDRILVWGGYVSRRGGALTYFTARKLVQSPEDFGTGCVVENTCLPQLLEPTITLCRSLGYTGIAEIEYKRDPRDGKNKLIEINPRHWDWHQLGAASGVNITRAAYGDLIGDPTPIMLPVQQKRTTKWVAEDTFITQALARLSERSVNPGKVWKQLAGKRMYSIFSWHDPMPLVRYSIQELLPFLLRSGMRKLLQQPPTLTRTKSMPLLISEQ